VVLEFVLHFCYWYSINFLEPNRYAKLKLDSNVYGGLISASYPQTSRLHYMHPGENLKPQYKAAYCTAYFSMNKTTTEATTQTWQRHSFLSTKLRPTIKCTSISSWHVTIMCSICQKQVPCHDESCQSMY